MVEVFRTNVNQIDSANELVHRIQHILSGTEVNFDLEDCDRILRVKSMEGHVNPDVVIGIVKKSGFRAEVLPDEISGTPHAVVQTYLKSVARYEKNVSAVL